MKLRVEKDKKNWFKKTQRSASLIEIGQGTDTVYMCMYFQVKTFYYISVTALG